MKEQEFTNETNIENLKNKASELLDIYFTPDYSVTMSYLCPVFKTNLTDLNIVYSNEQFEKYINSLSEDLRLHEQGGDIKEIITSNFKELRAAFEDAEVEKKLFNYIEKSYNEKLVAFYIVDMYYNYFNQNLPALITFLAVTQPEFEDSDVMSLLKTLEDQSNNKSWQVLQSIRNFILLVRRENNLVLLTKEILMNLED